MINPVKGNLIPLKDWVLAVGMDFGDQKTQAGIIVLSDDAKSEGIRPRWCQVWKIGKLQKDVKVGDWILVEHGRWTRTIKLEQDDGTILEVRRVDVNGIMATADEKPSGVQFGTLTSATPGESYDFGDMQRALT